MWSEKRVGTRMGEAACTDDRTAGAPLVRIPLTLHSAHVLTA